jgi:transposase
MKSLYRRCAGLDIHKNTISACVRMRTSEKPGIRMEEAVFGTFTQELERLALWLRERKVRQVAMESTGVYWRPVWNVLEQPKHRLHLTLVNPATVRALRGSKTDRIDARRIAEYLQYGLLRASYIPPKPVRHLRELTRLRVHIQQDRNRVINRIGRLLETANIKLSSVASDIVGKSGRAMLALLASGVTSPERLAQEARGLLRQKLPELRLAFHGYVDDHFRWMLSSLLQKLNDLDAELAAVERRIASEMTDYGEIIARLTTIPGIDRITAQVLIAELGADMSQFPTAAHAASWAGLCPGNAESAGKRFSGQTRKGDRYLRRILVQSAWAAARTKNCFLAALFFRVAQRRGMKKAAVAVAHRLLKLVYTLIAHGGVYQEQGGDYFDRLRPAQTVKKLTRRLERIGFQVQLQRRPLDPLPAHDAVPAEVCGKCHTWRLARCIHHAPRPKRSYSKFHPQQNTPS